MDGGARLGRITLSFAGFVVAIAVILATSGNSCTSANRTLVVPPEIAGAEFVGTSACGDCHADIVEHFASATHATMKQKMQKTAAFINRVALTEYNAFVQPNNWSEAERNGSFVGCNTLLGTTNL